MFCLHIFYTMNIFLLILYNSFIVLNINQILNTNVYYLLLCLNTSICGFIILYQNFLFFPLYSIIANLCLLFIILIIYQQNIYTFFTLTYDVYLLIYTVYLLTYKEDYVEIINIQQNNDYPEAINLSPLHHNQNYQKKSFIYV